MDVFEEKKQSFIEHCKIPYLKVAGIIPEVVEKGHVRFVMPVQDLHMNHVNIVYAGSFFVVAEAAGATLIFSAYAPERSYTPIIANVTIDYHKPATSDLVVDMSISEEEAAEKIAKINERGKGRYPLDVPVCDKEGNLCATAHITYYLYAK